MYTTKDTGSWQAKQRAFHALMLLLSFTLLVVTCPVKKWLYADNSTSVPAAARTHQTGIRLEAAHEQTSSSACIQLQKTDVPATSIVTASQKKPVAVLHYDIGTASGSALSYFLSGLPYDYVPSHSLTFHPLPLYLQLRTLLI